MSGGEGRKLSNQDIQLVQNRIEQCLQHYMNKKEVINALIIQDNIEPCITELEQSHQYRRNRTVNDQADQAVALALDYARDMILIWQRLEEENQEFFKVYYLKLLVKDQIMEFNRLLSEQVELMRRIGLSGITPFTSNGSHVSPTQHIPPTCPAQNTRPLKTENMQQANMFHNCGSGIQGTVDAHLHGRTSNLFLSQNSNVGLAQMMNGKSVKTEAGYAGSSPFAFSPPSNYLESRALMGDASVSSFSSVDSNAQHLNEPLLDGDTSSFGFLAQIPPSFPDLTTDFATSSDLLESYCRPPFLPTDGNNFVNPHGDIESLDPESESLRFQCFGGD